MAKMSRIVGDLIVGLLFIASFNFVPDWFLAPNFFSMDNVLIFVFLSSLNKSHFLSLSLQSLNCLGNGLSNLKWLSSVACVLIP